MRGGRDGVAAGAEPVPVAVPEAVPVAGGVPVAVPVGVPMGRLVVGGLVGVEVVPVARGNTE